MKVEKTNEGERLIIRSEDGNREIIVTDLIIALLVFVCCLIGMIEKDGRAFWCWFSGLIMTLMLIKPLFTWLATGKTIIMTKEGCTIFLWRYRKHYRWDELIVKKYVKGDFLLEEYRYPLGQSYREGIVFTKHKAKPVRWVSSYHRGASSGWMSPYSYCTFVRPLSSCFVNFYPLGVKEGHGDHKSLMEEYKARTGKNPFFTPEGITRKKQEVYPADKFEFLKYMEQWQVKIEGMTKMDSSLYVEEHD